MIPCSKLQQELQNFCMHVANFEDQEDKHPNGWRTNDLNARILSAGEHILQEHLNELTFNQITRIQIITAEAQRYFNRYC